MCSTTEMAPVSKKMCWIGRVISALVVLFLLFDAVTKVAKESHVLQATVRLGYPESLVVGIGILLLLCTAVYVIPSTSILGAILLTGYLGGAIASNVRAASPLLESVFPVIFGVLIWGGLYLRQSRLRTLIPLRK